MSNFVMQLLAYKSALGEKEADRQALPMLVHLEEVKRGHGGKDSIRVCVIYLQAMLACANAVTPRNDSLVRIVVDACNAFITASDRCLNHGNMQRVVLTVDESKTMSKAIRIFLRIMPQLQVGLWINAVEAGVRKWNQYEKTLELQAG